jgi:SNF2 family DNA or RNA helicase
VLCMSQVYVPKPYAGDAMRHLLKPRCALFAGMGSGKTVLVLTHLAIEYRYFGHTNPTLVLATQRVARSTWTDEAKKWAHLDGLIVVSVTGTERARTEVLKQGLRIGAHVFVTNYENLQWLRAKFPKGKWPFRKVVADEATKLKSFRLRQGGIRAQTLAQVAHGPVEEWINLTGTPASNGLQDQWGQMW